MVIELKGVLMEWRERKNCRNRRDRSVIARNRKSKTFTADERGSEEIWNLRLVICNCVWQSALWEMAKSKKANSQSQITNSQFGIRLRL